MERLRFVKRLNGFETWVSSYYLDEPADQLYNYNLLLFYSALKPEILRVIRQESLEIGPLKLNFAIRAILKKETQTGVETIDFFLRQETPILLNAFSREEVERKLDEEFNKKKEQLNNITINVHRNKCTLLERRKSTHMPCQRNVWERHPMC